MTQTMNTSNNTLSMFVRFIFIFWLITISYTVPVTAQTFPDISDKEFSKIVTTFSEYGGYFPSDNWISNELTYLNVLPSIEKNLVNGGVYLGVGPNQNFVYISAIKPQLAFIVDIRHQNTMQHLVYKVLFELADTRAEFLSLLFSKPLDSSSDLNKDNNIELIIEFFSTAQSDRQMLTTTRSKIESRLSNTYGFTLTERDKNALRKVLENFYQYNIDITYNGSKRSWYPIFGSSTPHEIRRRDTPKSL